MQDHARESIAGMKADELAQYQVQGHVTLSCTHTAHVLPSPAKGRATLVQPTGLRLLPFDVNLSWLLTAAQGIVAIGGDGVFQECIMGLIAARARGGAHAAAAARIRVGHIPGGSTDAVAYS